MRHFRCHRNSSFLQCEFKSFYILPSTAHSGLNSPSTRSQIISGFIYWIICELFVIFCIKSVTQIRLSIICSKMFKKMLKISQKVAQKLLQKSKRCSKVATEAELGCTNKIFLTAADQYGRAISCLDHHCTFPSSVSITAPSATAK